LKEFAVDLRKGRGCGSVPFSRKIFQSRIGMKFSREYFMKRCNLDKGGFEIG